MNTNAVGTLFFDGACGMCTRSRDLLLKMDRTGKLRTETLQSPGAAQRLGIAPTSLLESVRWLDSSGTVYSGAEAANAALSAAIGTRMPSTGGSPRTGIASRGLPRTASHTPAPAEREGGHPSVVLS